MNKRKLGSTDLELTCIGIGTWAIGGGDWKYGWGEQDDRSSINAIRKGLELGINWIDTAPAYGLGHSERIVGQAIAGVSPKPVIATKCGLVSDNQGGIRGFLKRASILKEIENSLKNLNIDRLDLLQIHWPNPDGDIEEAWRAINDAKRQGKVRYAGVSNFNSNQILRASAIAPVASLQPPYSMINRGIEKNLLPFCAEQNIGVVVYSPMQKGLLSGSMSRKRISSLPKNDHRCSDPDFKDPNLAANLQLAESLTTFAAKSGKTAAQCSIAWILRRPEVTAAIVGIRNQQQIQQVADASSWNLSNDEVAEIHILINARDKQLGIN
jgi:aryl-alcohol dehydrogenase-like predicted oxidoreductase